MFSIDDFWEILKVIQGEDGDVTDAVIALAKSEGANSETFFRNIIDQVAYYSNDYVRLRAFLRDWYATHRTIATFQTTVSDVYSIPNDQLDELFRSFGYNYSTSIRFPQSNNTPLEKSNFFLDLVNLYKVKGTPQGMLNILQYYGIGELSLYEFFLQFDNRPQKDTSELVFRGTVAATSSTNKSDIFFGYNVLTVNDPHWLYTESKIKQLNTTTKLNLPSRTPYFAVQPIFDESTVAVSMSLLVRRIQDLYKVYRDTGELPPHDANCTATGESVSVLALYLACIYFFDKQWNVNIPGDNFLCYDGDESNINAVILQHNRFTQERPDNRADIITRLNEYYDLFSRENARNFLQSREDAEYFLNLLYPDYKERLDNLTDRYANTLSSLLNDLGDWVKYNLNYGFINLNYFVFGLDALFSKLKEVINFFKPYHARLVPIEAIAFRNRTFNTIIVEDIFESVQLEQDIHDFVTGDGNPCCGDSVIGCPDSEDATLYYARELYDCGSYFDIGVTTDIRDVLHIDPLLDLSSYVICTPNLNSTTNIQTYVFGDDPSVVLDEETYVDSTLFGYWQQSGKPDFDDGGRFDCSTGRDFLELVVEDVNGSSSSSSSSSFRWSSSSSSSFESQTLSQGLVFALVPDGTNVVDFEPRDFIETPDNGFLIVGSAIDADVNYFTSAAKITQNGTLEWFKDYRMNNWASDGGYGGYCTFASNITGGYLLAGEDQYSAYGTIPNLFIKIDSTGNIIWNLMDEDNYSGGYPGPVEELSNGDLLCFTSGTYGLQNERPTLFKMSSTGTVLWGKRLLDSPNRGEYTFSHSCSDNSIITAFAYYSTYSQIVISKFTSTGSLTWSYLLSRTGVTWGEVPCAITETIDGGYILLISGQTYWNMTPTMTLMNNPLSVVKLTSSGNISWQIELSDLYNFWSGTPDRTMFSNIVETADGYVLCGTQAPSKLPVIAKISTDGTSVLWTKVVDITSSNYAMADQRGFETRVKVLSDDRIAMLINGKKDINTNIIACLVIVGADGSAFGCSYISDTSITTITQNFSTGASPVNITDFTVVFRDPQTETTSLSGPTVDIIYP